MMLRTVKKKLSRIVLGLYASYLRLNGVKIGKGGMISIFSKIDTTRGEVVIGDNVVITGGSYILSHSAVEFKLKPGKKQRDTTTIGDNVFIGVNSVILPGLTIGKNAIVGAGSIVTRDIPENGVVSGNPARLMKILE